MCVSRADNEGRCDGLGDENGDEAEVGGGASFFQGSSSSLIDCLTNLMGTED